MSSRDRFDITDQANGPGFNLIPPAEEMARQERPSRETIIRNYNAKDAQRARNARMNSQEAMQSFLAREERMQERLSQRREFENASSRRTSSDSPSGHMSQQQAKERARELRAARRMRPPMTTQESHDRTQSSRKAIEMERARRDAFSREKMGRTSNREVIDGRGSIDSRAFNERNELVGYSIDLTDRPEPVIDSSNQQSKWKSHAGQGFAPRARHAAGPRHSANADLDSLSDTISGRSDYGKGPAGIPLVAKILVVVIVFLVLVLIFLLFFA